MNIEEFSNGLEIIRKYYDKPAGYDLGAGHDVIYVYATNKPISPEDLEKLFALGWFQPDVDTGDEDPPKTASYDFAEGWGAYV